MADSSIQNMRKKPIIYCVNHLKKIIHGYMFNTLWLEFCNYNMHLPIEFSPTLLENKQRFGNVYHRKKKHYRFEIDFYKQMKRHMFLFG